MNILEWQSQKEMFKIISFESHSLSVKCKKASQQLFAQS